MSFNQSEYGKQWYQENRDRILEKQISIRRAQGKGAPIRYHFNDEQRQEIVNRLLNTNSTVRQVADEIGCSKSTIDGIFRAYTTKEQRLATKIKKQSESLRGRQLKAEKNERDPQHVKARTAVNNAVRDGRLTRAAICQQPGCTHAKTEAHHWHGYGDDHLLDVVWLCRKHHTLADNQPLVWAITFERVESEEGR